jgi:hypothetical protein
MARTLAFLCACLVISGTRAQASGTPPTAGTTATLSVDGAPPGRQLATTAPTMPWAVSAGLRGKANAVAAHADGSTSVTGKFSGTAPFGAAISLSSTTGSIDGFVGKLDSAGAFLWAVGFGSGSNDNFGRDIAVQADGSTFVTGSFRSAKTGTASFGAAISKTSWDGSIDGFVAKLNSTGAFLWAVGFGGAGSDDGRGIAAHADGSTSVTGTFAGGTATFGVAGILESSSGSNDGFVAKLDSEGAFLWAFRFGGESGDYGNAIAAHADGTTVVTGQFFKRASFGAAGTLDSTGKFDGFVAKLDSAGAFLWAVRFGGGSDDSGGAGIAAHADGSTVVTGSFQGTATFGLAGNLAILSLISTGSSDGFVAKLDSAGAFLWAVRFGGLGGDHGYGIAAHADGSTLVTGYFKGTATFGASGISLSSAGADDGFVAKLDSTGAFLSATRFGGGNSDIGFGIAAHADGSATVAGQLGSSTSVGTSPVDAGGFVSAAMFTCAAGLHSTALGGVAPCTTCAVAQYQDTAGSSACVECNAGKFRGPAKPSAAESEACVPCTAGTYALAGAVACDVCPAGQYAEANGASLCPACPDGKYQPNSNQTFCSACAAGKHRSAGSTCVDCAAGTYADAAAMASCKDCPSGKFQNVTSQSACMACNGGVSNGQTACVFANIKCPDGQAGTSTCAPCTPGKFKAGTNTKPCENCACGTFSTDPGATECGGSCLAGKYGDGSKGVCAPCPAAHFCIDSQKRPDAKATVCIPGEYEVAAPSATSDRVCTTCAAGHFSEANTVGCQRCPEGKYQDRGGQPFCEVTQPCAPGTFVANTTDQSNARCQPCPTMHFSGAINAASCTLCPAGKFQNTVGQPFCETKQPCAPGTFEANASDPTPARCAPCAAGSFSDTSNAALCTVCPANTFQLKPGQPFCEATQPCTPGTFVANVSDPSPARCAPCAAGSFSDTTNAGLCSACPANTFQLEIGQPFCEATQPCIPGTFVANVSDPSPARCAPCAAGSFSDTSNAGLCTACPANTFQLDAGQPFCKATQPCTPGTFVANASDPTPARCAPCAAGSFSDTSNAGVCTACPANTFQLEIGQLFCEATQPCIPGTFVANASDPSPARCAPCAAGSFSDTSNAGLCTACPANTFQLKPGQPFCKATQPCTPGTFVAHVSDPSPARCAPCAAGSFSDTSNARACAICPDGAYQSTGGKGFCTTHAVCAKGERVVVPPSATADRTCSPCEPGSFSTSINAASCTACPANTFQLEAGQPYCEAKQPCAPGTFEVNTTDTSSVRCKPCSAGSWCQNGTEYRCGSANLFCPAQSSTPTAVAIGHYSVKGPNEFHRETQVPCEPGFSCAQGIRQACPLGRVCQLGSAKARVDGIVVNVTAETLCDADKFAFGGACLPCPARGANCIDGQITLKRDFWYDARHGETGDLTEFWGKRQQGVLSQTFGIYRCAPGSCVRNASSGLPACTAGRRGPLCAVCNDGYYATDISGCEPCPTGTASAVQAVALCAFVLAAAMAAVHAKRKIEAQHPKLAASIAQKLPEVLKLLTGLFQILSAFTVAMYRVPWPSAFSSVTSFFSVVSLDMFSLPSLRCSSLGSTYFARFTLHTTSMLVLTALFAALLLYAYSRHNQSRTRPLKASLVWNLFLPFLFLIYPSISKTVILMLRCRTIDGVRYLLSDISISCETAEYAGHKRYAIFGVLVFPIGIVVFFTVLVGRNRHKLPPDWWPVKAPEKQAAAYDAYIAEGRVGDWQAHVDEEGRAFFWSDTLQQSSWEDPAAAETDATPAKPFAAWLAEIWDPQMLKYDKLYKRVGFLTSTYTQRYWWFESLVTVYKLAMTVLVMFVSDGDENKILFGMLIATAMMAFFSFYQPFRHRDILSINTGAQLVVLLVLFAAMFLLRVRVRVAAGNGAEHVSELKSLRLEFKGAAGVFEFLGPKVPEATAANPTRLRVQRTAPAPFAVVVELPAEYPSDVPPVFRIEAAASPAGGDGGEGGSSSSSSSRRARRRAGRRD